MSPLLERPQQNTSPRRRDFHSIILVAMFPRIRKQIHATRQTVAGECNAFSICSPTVHAKCSLSRSFPHSSNNATISLRAFSLIFFIHPVFYSFPLPPTFTVHLCAHQGQTVALPLTQTVAACQQAREHAGKDTRTRPCTEISASLNKASHILLHETRFQVCLSYAIPISEIVYHLSAGFFCLGLHSLSLSLSLSFAPPLPPPTPTPPTPPPPPPIYLIIPHILNRPSIQTSHSRNWTPPLDTRARPSYSKFTRIYVCRMAQVVYKCLKGE
ncbi:unnamed protein product [Protopolystoma xenopodis]|uniref:Uncharacterized protein n=1 Tax=Protopolystoma xenopodis TaxID=117903 RepID=A0A3S5AWN8_9PLAT|nr:unnamed protein product [Protopolystoma xenopodis]